MPNAELNAIDPKVLKVATVPILPKLSKPREGDNKTGEEKGTDIGIFISLPDGMASVPTIGVKIDTDVAEDTNDGAALIADGFETEVLHAVEGGASPISCAYKSFQYLISPCMRVFSTSNYCAHLFAPPI